MASKMDDLIEAGLSERESMIEEISSLKKELEDLKNRDIVLIDLNSGKSYEEMRNAILVQWYAKEKSFKKLGKACGVPERTLRSWLKNSF